MSKYVIHNKFKFVCLILLKLINTIVFLYFSILIKDIINVAMNTEGKSELLKYVIVGVIYCVLLILCYIAVATLHSHYMNEAMYKMKNDYCNKIFLLPYERFAEKESATYISNLSNDMNMIRNGYLEEIFAIIDSSMSIIVAFIYIYQISASIAIYVLLAASVLPIFPIVMEEKMMKADRAISDANEKYTAELKMILSGMDIVKTYSSSKSMFNRFKGVNEKVKKTKIHNDMLIISLSSMSTTVTNIIKVGLIIVGVFYALQKRIDVGAVTALFVLSSSFYNPVMSLCYEIGDIMGTKAIVNKIGEILNYNVPKEKMFVEKVKCIRLENISFSYNDNKQALENIDLSFEAGKKYLIIGESGSGKTTLFRLLLKMNTGYIGNIYINGDEYRNISEESIYKIIGYAKQDTYIFNGTLKENIDINGTNDREKMTECIQKCRLEKFMANLPNGLETNIGEEINKISEGEKMRICLARALYKECDVLLLDEITASLDPINSKEVEKVITSITDKIVINICHKYDEDTLKTYDKIVVLDGGRIVNVGTYEELKNRKVLE